MSTDPHNQQYGGVSLFGMDTAPYASTGADGSAGDTASQSLGPVVGSPVVSIPGASSQVASSMPTVPVLAGDTSAMSSDQAVGDNFAEIAGGDAAAMSATGAGTGRAEHMPHPNAGK